MIYFETAGFIIIVGPSDLIRHDVGSNYALCINRIPASCTNNILIPFGLKEGKHMNKIIILPIAVQNFNDTAGANEIV